MARILVIEDDPTIQMVLREILVDEGYEIVMANNGLTALKVIREEPLPDLVITDLRMPDMNGKTFVQTLRVDPACRELPIMIVTGAVANSADFPPAGSYQALIAKPFDLKELLAKVADLVGYESQVVAVQFS